MTLEIEVIMSIALAIIIGLELKHERCLGRIEAEVKALTKTQS